MGRARPSQGRGSGFEARLPLSFGNSRMLRSTQPPRKLIGAIELNAGEVLLAEVHSAPPQSAPPPRWAWLSRQLANSGIDPDQPLVGLRRGALILGIAVLILAIWQVFSGAKGPIPPILAVTGFFAELALIALAGFCGLFAVAFAAIWIGRRLSLW